MKRLQDPNNQENQKIISMSKIKTKNILIVSLQTKNELNNITYDLIHQCLDHPGNKNIQIRKHHWRKI